MKLIVAEMRSDWVEPYARTGSKIPVVVVSTHPQYKLGTRLDYGFVQVALDQGYDVYLRQQSAEAK